MMESQPILFHLMLKQGFNWFTLASKDVEIDLLFYLWIDQDLLTDRHGRCRLDHMDS